MRPAEVKVKVEQSSKKPKGGQICLGKPIYPLTGTERYPLETGITVGGIALQLTYDTAKQKAATAASLAPKDFGDLPSFGGLWMSSLHRRLAIGLGEFGINAHRGDGHIVNFAYVNGAYSSDADAIDQLKAVTGGYQLTAGSSKSIETYNTTGQLTSIATAQGSTLSYTYSDANTSINIAPAAGYLIAVTDNTGRSIHFEYSQSVGSTRYNDARISKIVTPTGQSINAAYDNNTNLISLSWPDSKTKTFLYEHPNHTWALTGIVDENASRYATIGYDAAGNAISSELAGGVDKYVTSYTSAPQAQRIELIKADSGFTQETSSWSAPSGVAFSKPDGQSNTISSTNVQGMSLLSSQSQPAGSGCAAATSAQTYDANANITSHDDFSGNRSCYAYDAKNQETTRVEGLAKSLECASVLPATAQLPANARKTTTSYHPDWRLASRIESAGSITHNIYQGQPDPFNANQIANCTAAANMPNGKPLPLLCKQAISDRSKLVAHDPDAAYQSVSLLLHGNTPLGLVDSSPRAKVLTATGGATVSTAQSMFGGASMYFPGGSNLISVPSSDEFDFGAGDFAIEFWMRPANVTVGTAVLVDRGAYSNYTPWVIWQSGKQVGLSASATGSSWLAGIASGDVLVAGQWSFVKVQRVNGVFKLYVENVLKASQAAAGSLQVITSPVVIGRTGNGYYPYAGHIDDLRITKGSGREAEGVPTQQYWDTASANMLVPSLTSSYAYDAQGRVLTSTDPQGRVSSYTYAATTAFTGTAPTESGATVGDLTSITAPGGYVTTFDAYDRAGRVLKSTDPKGVVTDISYTPRGWVSTVSTTAPGQSVRTTSYTYDNAGQLTAVATPDGQSITYGYDAAHRLVSVRDAKGNRISYTLDNMGNRIKEDIQDPAGVLQRSISRSFDALNRLQQVSGATQ